MLAKRIIPCLDIQDGRVVKGINFINLRDAGDPVEQARIYNDAGADELVFLDISASVEGRRTTADIVSKVAEQVFIPLTVGGGIKTVEDIRRLLMAGADKVSVNTAAVYNPQLISDGAYRFGSQCIIISVDARRVGNDKWEVVTHGGRKPTGMDALEWIRKAVDLGAGEVLLTSIDADGTLSGYDIPLTRTAADTINVPMIASGGAGKCKHFADVLTDGNADAALAASLFHDNVLSIPELKTYLSRRRIPIRMVSHGRTEI